MSLKQLQTDFMEALIDPRATGEFLDQIQPCGNLSAAQHIAIYQRSYIARLQQCMASQFSALKTALGDELFSLFTADYLRAFPSHSYTLNNLGARFAEHLEATRPAIDPNNEENWPAFVVELARFEYHVNDVFDLKIDDASVRNVIATESRRLNRSARLCSHEYPVCRYFNDIKENPNADIPYPQREFCILFRHNYRVVMLNVLDDQEIELFKRLARGNDWDSACLFFNDLNWLEAVEKRWVGEGLLV
ncbi:DNA-binding domain-containing protein [Marinomonas mediterranea]|uniref:HvfC/BufC N-terminal domain-containing protein n=1 Tax=Marinomonas mediterranea TaxID=119864 RepID=UPI002348F899|nr:DNA-binding domain-containing protein [Marinomonas mediterranea]WCN09316.1 hypothetical protein GV055_10425 [Marinomonas mediterranea]WCN13398.1 hypothetical protein GV054_10430 [Marinomonas mediterranea]